MRTVIIACRTVEQELTAVMNRINCTYPVTWLESGLHNVPSRLCRTLQEAIDTCAGYDRILLAMGFCGNAVLGIHSDTCEIILPRAEDCIGLFLGSRRSSQELVGSYFFTEGWLRGERTIWWEYQRAIERYGEPRARRIFDTMLRNYRRILLVNTGCFQIEPVRRELQRMAEAFSLETAEIEADLDLLSRLLTGPWEEDAFIRLPRGQTLDERLVHL